jgi:HK97 family phage portal protein
MFEKRDATTIAGPETRSAYRGPSGLTVTVKSDAALRQSVGWAAIMLRAGLISSFPIDTFRKVNGVDFAIESPPVITDPFGRGEVSIGEWMHSTQVDLDRVGNCYGIIRETDGLGKPREIELVRHENVTVKSKNGVVTYVIRDDTGVSRKYSAAEVWHERQYTVPGLVMGLSPIAYAAWSLGLWATAAEFAAEWFTNHGITPTGILRNIEKTLQDGQADQIKGRFKEAVQGGDIFVTGKDWEYTTGPTASAESLFIQQMDYSDQAMCRFYGVPANLVDVAVTGQNITYANVTQANLQFLIMKLGPAVQRRETALSRMLVAPRFVKLNTAALLRMDPETTSRILINEVNGMLTSPSEARALMNKSPFTPDQIAEFKELGIIAAGTPAPAISIQKS